MTYEGYARKRCNHMPTDSYFYPARQLKKFTIINLRGPVRTQKTSMQNMSNSKMSTQKIPNLHACSRDER